MDSMSQRVTPLLKCMVLFMFIFTAKVFTSRPQDSQDLRNDVQHVKPLHYVRTFTKYHHRRTMRNNLQDFNNYGSVIHDQQKFTGKRSIDYITDSIDEKIIEQMSSQDIEPSNNLKKYWPLPQYRRLEKRSLNSQNSNELMGVSHAAIRLDTFTSDSVQANVVGSSEKKAISNTKNGLPNEIKSYKVKQAIIVTDAPTTMGPTISCYYKIHDRMIMSVKYDGSDDDKNAQVMVENDSFDTGKISETTLPNNETAQIVQCSDSRASCYTLLHQDTDGNVTILGQGCWRSSQSKGRNACDKCTRVTASNLPASKFCCCTKSFCNADFMSLKEETVTMKAESTMDISLQEPSYLQITVSALLVVIIIAVTTLMIRKFLCKQVVLDKDDMSDGVDVEKGEVMGSGPDALATGLSCVDNLSLIEHVGQGKFGSVWRGTLGATPVAVKLYSSASVWQREASVYALPHLAHPNILRYYGSDTRPTLTEGGREHLIVVELCSSTLRARLERAPLTWYEFANIAHGLSSALAHLHTPSANKPCIVHRDVNSTNVLVTANGDARLADLGLAQLLHSKRDRTTPTRITEAGTLRYLAPEALEGALDLSGARAALCAVDVFALGLVLWEALWRTRGAHAHGTPPYAPPYHNHGLTHAPTLHQMQTIVSRNKSRPPLPKGPVQQSRVLKIAADTCDECWDHDAEARLTAVCVEERMAELKHMLHNQGPLIHDNNLHPHSHQSDSNIPSPAETDKNSNCTSAQNFDVTTPLLYPHPHIGRNACIERNTHTNTQQHTVELIHKSLKDITVPVEINRVQKPEENCLSVARITHTRVPVQENSGLSEIRSYQRPLDYVQNDVTAQDVDRGPKETNLLQDVKVEKPKWGFRNFFKKLNRNKMETQVKLAENSKTTTSVVGKPNNDRPANLILNQENYNFEGPCTLSPPNKTLSATMMKDSTVFGFKEMPSKETDAKTSNQIFAVIVPKVKPPDFLEMKNQGSSSSDSLKRSVKTSLSSQSIAKTLSESEDSTVKKRLSCDNKIINSAASSRVSVNLELQYIDNPESYNGNISPFDINSDCSSSEDEHLLLLSENGGSKITIHTIPKIDIDKKKYQNEVLKESSQPKTDFSFNKFQNKYTNFDNEFSDPNDKENLVNGYSGDNPVYLAALNGEIDTADLKLINSPKSPKPILKNLTIKRQRSLEHVSEIFSSSGDMNLLNPAGRVKTPGDLPVAVRRARRDRALQKGRASECNRLSLYDDRMMFGNSL